MKYFSLLKYLDSLKENNNSLETYTSGFIFLKATEASAREKFIFLHLHNLVYKALEISTQLYSFCDLHKRTLVYLPKNLWTFNNFHLFPSAFKLI